MMSPGHPLEPSRNPPKKKDDSWKDGVGLLVFVVIIISFLSGLGYSLYTIGYTNGGNDMKEEMRKEAIEAGVMEYGPNPNAKSHFWKKP